MPTFEARLRAAVLVITAVTAWTMLIAETTRDVDGPLVALAPAAVVAPACAASPSLD
jgi:hypothetical protein